MNSKQRLPVTLWMNMPSFYQEDMFCALNATGQIDLRVIYAHPLPDDRLALGWKASLSGYDYRFLSNSSSFEPTALAQAIRLAQKEGYRFHIVNGIWAVPEFGAGLVAMYMSNTRYAIYSEAPNPRRQRTRLQIQAKNLLGRKIIKRASGVLPIAQFGIDYYRSLGATEVQIYPFGYFRNIRSPSFGDPEVDAINDTVEYVYVGQLIHRKGIDILLRAFSKTTRTTTAKCHLTILGDGRERQAYEAQVRDLGLESRVSFLGSRPSTEIQAYIQRSDALILPSRWDGWGLVVNEALLSGVPVIVSDACGAAMLIENGKTGYVFSSENVDALATCLDAFIEAKKQNHDFRPAVTALGMRISTESAADYLVRCISHMCQEKDAKKPSPPWEGQ